jgi:MurNAc alpha-1-phosphate uridylyltransferase
MTEPLPNAAAAALVLAAGRGSRMRPLTDHTPKPLLAVRGRPLMQWPMDALVRAGVTRLAVNTAWLGAQIEGFATDWAAQRPGLSLTLSREGADFGDALETLGGVVRALPALGDLFWVVAGDVFAPAFDFAAADPAALLADGALAHLWLVPNPAHHPGGDFGLSADGQALNGGSPRFTFSTIGLYRRALFEAPWCDIPAGNPQGVVAPLAPLLRRAMDAGRVRATLYTGPWTDVGTPERLAALNA